MASQELYNEEDVRHCPLGATVREYEKASSFFPKSIAVTATALGVLAWWLWSSPPATPLSWAGWSSLVALLIAAVVGQCYILVRVWRWLPTVFEPCYELRHADGRVVAPPPAIQLRPYDRRTGANHRAEWERALTASDAARQDIVLHAVYSDRLGNHLFQYTYARLRAAYLDVAFVAPPLAKLFEGVATHVHRWAATASSTGAAGTMHRQLLRLRECCSTAATATCPGCGSPASAQSALRSTAWQHAWDAAVMEPACRYSFNTRQWAGHEGEVASWFLPSLHAARDSILCAPAPAPPVPAAAAAAAAGTPSAAQLSGEGAALLRASTARTVVIHVRLGDILWGHHGAYRPLPMSYYRQALAAIRAAAAAQEEEDEGSTTNDWRCVLVSEVASHPLLSRMTEQLRKGVPKLCSSSTGAKGDHDHDGDDDAVKAGKHAAEDGEEERWHFSEVVTQSCSLRADLLTLCAAQWLVGSISSFAWWPAFLGACRGVVLPGWGMLLTHSWRPSVHFPVHIQHDMAVPCLPLSLLYQPAPAPAQGQGQRQAQAAAPVPASQLATQLQVLMRAKADGISIRPLLPAAVDSLQQAEHEHDEEAEGAGATAERKRVLLMPLPNLRRWPGNTGGAIESLFD